MVIKYKDKEITMLEDIQKLKVKELRDISVIKVLTSLHDSCSSQLNKF